MTTNTSKNSKKISPTAKKIYLDNSYWLIVAAAVFALDQISKYLIARYLPLEMSIPILQHFNLFFTYNTGAAFSFLENANGWQEWLFCGLAIGASLVIVRWLFYAAKGRKLDKCALMFVLGGAIGNLYDRLFFGHVLDFIDIYWQMNLPHWPVFNFADAAICIGAVMLIIEIFRQDK